MDIGTLEMIKVIIHSIPKHPRTEKGTGPGFSEVESRFDPGSKADFRATMVNSLADNVSFPVIAAPTTTSPVPKTVMDYLTTRGDGFLPLTKGLAEHLFQTQDGKMSEGLLAVVDCRVDEAPALGILKLERINGSVADEASVDGQRTYDVTFIKNLITHSNSRLFKAAVLQVHDGVLEGAVRDNQISKGTSGGVASFFLSNFLGCTLREEPQVSTRRFYQEAEKFINNLDAPGEVKATYMEHLVSELSSNRPDISLRRFAGDYLREEHQMGFVLSLSQAHIPATFAKNVSLVKGQIAKMVMEFHHGVTLSAKSDVFKEHVTLSSEEDGRTKAVIVDELKRVGGRS